MKFKKKLIIFIGCSVILNSLGLLLVDKEAIKFYGFSICFILFLFLFLYYKENKKIITLSTLFIIFSCLFHMGHSIIFFLNENYLFTSNDLIGLYGVNIFVSADRFSMFVITIICFGILSYKKNLDIKSKKTWKMIETSKVSVVAKIMLLLSFPIRFSYDLKVIQTVSLGNYFDAFTLTQNVFTWFLSQLFTVSALLVICTAESKKRRYIYSILIALYFIWTMQAGGRGNATIVLVIIIYIVLNLQQKLSFKTWIIIFVVGYVGMVFLTSIGKIRNEKIPSFSNISETIEIDSLFQPLYNTLEEFGGTKTTLEVTMLMVPEYKAYSIGETYLYSLVSIIPNINGVFTKINKEANYVNTVNTGFLGGSYIGELYFNFGILSFPLPLIIGMFVQSISFKIEKALEDRNYLRLAAYLPLSINILWWVRDVFSSLIRSYVWFYIFFFVMNIILSEIKIINVNYKRRIKIEK